MGHLRNSWLQMNCFVSKQPILGELIIIMKPSSITAAFQQLAESRGGGGGRAWGKRQQHRVYHFLKLLTMRLTQKPEIPFPGCSLLGANLAGLASFIQQCQPRCCWAVIHSFKLALVKEMTLGHREGLLQSTGRPKEQN